MTFSPSDPNEPSHAEPLQTPEPRLATREPLDDTHHEHPRPALFAASLRHRLARGHHIAASIQWMIQSILRSNRMPLRIHV